MSCDPLDGLVELQAQLLPWCEQQGITTIDLMVERYAREQEDARRRDRLARWESSPPDDPLLAELNAELHRRGSTTITDLPAQPTDPRPEPADTAPGQQSKRNAAKATLPLVLASVDGCYRSLCRVCSVGFPLAGDLRHPAGRRPAPASLMAPPIHYSANRAVPVIGVRGEWLEATFPSAGFRSGVQALQSDCAALFDGAPRGGVLMPPRVVGGAGAIGIPGLQLPMGPREILSPC